MNDRFELYSQGERQVYTEQNAKVMQFNDTFLLCDIHNEPLVLRLR